MTGNIRETGAHLMKSSLALGGLFGLLLAGTPVRCYGRFRPFEIRTLQKLFAAIARGTSAGSFRRHWPRLAPRLAALRIATTVGKVREVNALEQ